ncbi:MAG TPA: hypothetical protein VGF07_08675, partial [Stellaceae bacterium]
MPIEGGDEIAAAARMTRPARLRAHPVQDIGRRTREEFAVKYKLKGSSVPDERPPPSTADGV